MRASSGVRPAPVMVRLERAWEAPIEDVFDAWLDPATLARWMFGPAVRDEELVHLQVDPRVGGRFSFLVRRAGVEFDHVGSYLAIDRPRRLAFTWDVGHARDDGSAIELDLTTEGGQTRLALVHILPPEAADYADRTRAGWMRMLAMLGRVVEHPEARHDPGA